MWVTTHTKNPVACLTFLKGSYDACFPFMKGGTYHEPNRHVLLNMFPSGFRLLREGTGKVARQQCDSIADGRSKRSTT